MNPLLTLDQVSCDRANGRGPVRALDRVSLSLGEGEVVAVMGPSGSGKSTLIHSASGVLPLTTGTIAVLGQPPPARAQAWWSTQRRYVIGVVHQRLNLIPGLPVLDNVALPLVLGGAGRRAARDAAEEALARTGIEDLHRARPEELSVGEQQRVAVARAIVGRRRVVLADEPTAALDTVHAEAVVQLLVALARKGRGVLFTTHDSRMASWADRIVSLRDGAVVTPRPNGDPVPLPPPVDVPVVGA